MQLTRYEMCADDLRVIRIALRQYVAALQKEYHKIDERFTAESEECAHELRTAEDMIDRFDQASNVYMELE